MRAVLLVGVLVFSVSSFAQTEASQFRKYSGLQKGKEILTAPELAKLYEDTVENPVAKLDNLGKYDPTGIIGFCYGRAMTAQLIARKMGLAEASMAKLFIVGAMCSDKNCNPDQPEWRFHVTTIVKGQSNWYAIDPIVYKGNSFRPLTVNAWIKEIRETYDTFHKQSPKTRLYMTSVETILPDIRTLDTPEKGDKVIELNFLPEKNGITAKQSTNATYKIDEGVKVYELDQTLGQKYFLTLDEEERNRFSFLDIKINGDAYPYHGYFVDLFESLEKTPRGPIMAGTRSVEPKATPNGAVGLGSFKLPIMR